MGGVRNLNFYSDFPIDFPSTLDLYRSGAGDTTIVWHDDAHHADSINVIDTGRDVCRSVTMYGTVYHTWCPFSRLPNLFVPGHDSWHIKARENPRDCMLLMYSSVYTYVDARSFQYKALDGKAVQQGIP